MQKVLVIATNLFFLPRIQNTAAPIGCDTRQVMTIERLHEELADDKAVLALVDLEADPDFWGDAVRTVLASGPFHGLKIVGYGGHTNTEMLQRAEEAGCDLVLTKGQFSRDLSNAHSRGRRVSRHERLTVRTLMPSPHFLLSPPHPNSPYILFGTPADAIVVSRS